MYELSVQQARRIAVRAAGLTLPRPTTWEHAMDAVTAITLDHTSYICPSAELVLWSRLGDRFSPQELADALAARDVIEIQGTLQQSGRFSLYRAEMDEWPGEEPAPYRAQQEHWMHANQDAAREILEILREQGPLPPRALRVEFAVPHRSSGWNNDKSTAMMLERLADAGQVAVSRREGRQRFWDLGERIYPDVSAVPAAEAERRRNESRLAVQGLSRANGPDCDPGVGEVGEEATIDGVRGLWRVDPAQLEQTVFQGRTALLSPFDPLVRDRHRMKELFGSDYALEMYKPVVKRRFGYYALPILHGDALIGKADLEADHARGVLEVHALHQDCEWIPDVADAVETEIRSLAAMLELDLAEEGLTTGR